MDTVSAPEMATDTQAAPQSLGTTLESTAQPSTTTTSGDQPVSDAATETETHDDEGTKKDPKYPLHVSYCPLCSLPAELHDYVSKNQFEKCKEWLRKNGPEHFPDLFPEECAARLEALKIAEETGVALQIEPDNAEEKTNKVAIPIEQKTSGGKKKKTPAEILLALGQRKGKKQVTIVYGLDLFGIKLKEAAKAAKRKFATGSSITTSADSREVIEIQGSRQEDFAQLVHKEWGVPKEAIFIVNAQKKKVRAFP